MSQTTPDRLYNREFYVAQIDGSLHSAGEVVPKINELIGMPAFDTSCGMTLLFNGGTRRT